MKTEYEKRHKYGINNIIFGKPNKLARKAYWIILIILLILILFLG